MVVTSHPEAVAAGLRVLDAGGSAADAAIAAAAVLCVVDPRSTGIGGDLFALHWEPGGAAPTGIQGAGWSASGLTPEYLAGKDILSMPVDGALTVTVPGSVSGWIKLHERFGKLDLGKVLAPAISIAHAGYIVAEVIEREWRTAREKLRRTADGALFLRDGETPTFGSLMRNPALGDSLEKIASDNGYDFYHGETARRIADTVAAQGGLLTVEDIGDWPGAQFVTPVSTNYRGHEVFQMPPPGQGLVVLEALAILDRLAYDPVKADVFGAAAVGTAVVDGAREIADPAWRKVKAESLLLDPGYLDETAALIGAGITPLGDARMSTADTVYVTVVDSQGRACSLIQSVYQSFGSGVVVGDRGFALQNRGANFTLENGHVNQVGPRKLPYHTIIPSLVLKSGELFSSLGVVGGFMQPQGQVQILQKLIDQHESAGTAVADPRWRWVSPGKVAVEHGFNPARRARFQEFGYFVDQLATEDAGGAQVIVQRDGHLEGGSDWRKDGLVGVL